MFCNGRNKVWICAKKGAVWPSWTLTCIVSKIVTLLIIPSLKEENKNHLSEDVFLRRTLKSIFQQDKNNNCFTLSQHLALKKTQMRWLLQAFLKHVKKCSSYLDMRASNIPGEISTSCNSAEQPRLERVINCLLHHGTPECHCSLLQSIPQRAWRWRLCPAPSPTPSSAFLNKSRETKQMEELMSNGHVQNKQRIPKRHGPGRCFLPNSLYPQNVVRLEKFCLFWFLSGLINWKSSWTKCCSLLTDRDASIHHTTHLQ